MRLLGRLREPGAPRTIVPEPRVAESAALTTLLWVLAAWTAFCGLSLVFLQGNVTRVLAAGLSDHPGQRLLGVQLLALAVVYGLAAWRRGRDGLLTWLATATQLAIAAVCGFDALAGHRGFGDAAFALLVALAFGLLLLAFRLAGEPSYLVRAPHHSTTATPPRPRWPDDLPTERLGSTSAPDPPPARADGAHDPNDDEPLGL